MELVLTRNVYEKIISASESAAPLEACGMLAGRGRNATHFYLLTNADASPEHFSMLPAEQFAAVKDMRERGVDMLAIWHSHPASPPRMSEEDLRLAFTPDVVYVIISLVSADSPVIKGFHVKEGAVAGIEVVVEHE